jgi:hypothetical protein
MPDKTVWLDFIQGLRARQDELREYLARFEGSTMHTGRGGVDTTAQEMDSLRREIVSLQETIDRVIAEQGLSGA